MSENKIIALVIVAVVTFFISICTLGSCLERIDSHELGYAFDLRSGKTWTLNRTGYFWRVPFVQEFNTIDLRPMQTCINANSRVLNCKLIKFNPAGLQEFIALHGRGTYTQSDLEPILKSYAYEDAGHNYSFLTVLREMKTEAR